MLNNGPQGRLNSKPRSREISSMIWGIATPLT